MPRSAVTTPRRNVNNLVFNGDFEYAPAFTAATTTNAGWIDGTASGSTANAGYGWCFAKDQTASAQFDTSEKKSGNYSMKLSTLAVNSGARVNQFRSTSALTAEGYIPVLSNTSYTVSGWVKTNLISGSSRGAYIRAQEFSGTSTTAIVTNETTYIPTTTDWTYYTKTFVTNSSTRFIAVGALIVGTTGSADLIMDAWFDDIVLTKTTPDTRSAASSRSTVANLVTNGDFEYAPAFTAATTGSRWIDGTSAGSLSNSIYKWRLAVGSGTVSAQFDNTVYKNGTGSMKIATNPGGYCEVVTSTTKEFGIPVLPSTSYTISGWMKTEAVSGSATSGARIIAAEYSGAFVGGNIAQTTNIQTTTDWTYYTKTFTTASTTRFIVASCNVRGDNGAATLSMNAWFDDIVLTKTTPDARTAA